MLDKAMGSMVFVELRRCEMKSQIIAVLITEGGKLVSEYLRRRPIHIKSSQSTSPELTQELEIRVEDDSVSSRRAGDKTTDVATGCIPCAIGHVGTCSGLLNEGKRFADRDGVDSSEVIDRVNMCLDELNTMERVDLRPEKIVDLEPWEKELATMALTASRDIRHNLESIRSVSDLEKTAADTQNIRAHIGRTWFKEKMKRMSKEEKAEVAANVMRKLENLDEK